MTQPSLFDETVPSLLCSYQNKPCWKGGRMVYGPYEVHEGCINRTMRCLMCPAHGEESANTERKPRGKRR